MIEEDYVSYEVAQLLKEKGFSERSYGAYNLQREFQEGYGEWNKTAIYYAAPTHQMAIKWLREEHNLFIELRAGEIDGKTWYDFDIIPINGRIVDWNHYINLPMVELNSYEEAVEAALKYSLENLI